MAALFVALLELVVSLLAAAVGFARAAQTESRRARVAWSALGVVPFVLVHAYVAWMGVALRFDVGVGNAVWGLGVALFAAHVVGALVLRSRAANRPVFPLLFAFVACLAFESAVLWGLEQRGRLEATLLANEAGRIAYRESAEPMREEQNAAPIYSRSAAIVAPDDGVSVDDWADALGADETLDPRDPKLVQALAGWSSAIEAARAATKLPYCRFEAANAEEIVPVPRVFPLIGLTHAFALEARVRAANGDVHGALEDVRALFALARHLVGTPVFISVAMAGVTQELGLDTLAHVLAGGNVSVDELAAFPFEPIVLSGELVQRALRLEQAFGFGMIGLAGREGSIRPSDAGPFAGPVGVLYTGLLLEDEVRGYRDVMEEFQAHAKLSVTELAKVVDRESLARRVRSRGVLATLLTPNVDDRLMAFHRFDARTKLARIALRAATVRAQQGAWPTAANFRVDEPNVVLEGDGTFLLLRDTTPGFESAPELRVPPSGKR